MRKRTSIIYSVDKETLQQYISESQTIGQILKKFGLENRGHNPRTLKKRIQEESLDISHITQFKFGGGWNKGTSGILKKKMSKENALTKIFTSNYQGGSSVKKYIRYYNLIPEVCGECNLGKEWNKKPITLELDHIDGDSSNNQLANLRWLCPNCHSQTDTFRGRKLRKRYYCKCGKEIIKGSTNCRPCSKKVVGLAGFAPMLPPD